MKNVAGGFKVPSESERQPGLSIHEYAVFIVPSYPDGAFRSHFCLSCSSAEILVGLVAQRLQEDDL